MLQYRASLGLLGALLLVLGGWLAFKGFEPVWDEFVAAMESGDSAAFDTITADNLNLGYIVAFGLVAAVITFAYAVFFLSRTGATPGKMALGISVRLSSRAQRARSSCTTGSAAGAAPAILRPRSPPCRSSITTSSSRPSRRP